MTRPSKSCKFLGRSTRPRRVLLCRARDNTCRMSRKALRDPQICPKPRLSAAVGTSLIALAPFAENPASAAGPAGASCTTWATALPGGPATSTLPTRSIVARAVASTSTPTCPTTPRPRPPTPIGWWPWPSDSWWRTASPIKLPAGTCGVTTAFHILQELTKAIRRAVAKVRKRLAARKPPLTRGRPSTPAAKRAARQRQRLQQKSADLFEHRPLFVQHDLTLAQRRTLRTIP